MDNVTPGIINRQIIGVERRKSSTYLRTLLILLALLFISSFVALRLGPIPLSTSTITHILLTPFDQSSGSSDSIIIWQVRLPRIILAVLVGMTLAASGIAFQSLLRSDLAEPYILGISSGASIGAALVGISTLTGELLQVVEPLAAFCGAGVVLFIVMSISLSYGRIDTRSLLLSGVVVSAFFWAVEMAALRIAGRSFDTILNWLMGSLANADWPNVAIIAIVLPICLVILMLLSPSMNLYAVGEDSAKQLGLNAEQFKWILILTATVLASLSVSMVGIIGFIGLIAPHIGRRLAGTPDHRKTIPLAVLSGAILMVWSDTLARILLSGDILPVGIITAFLGAPFFIYKMRQERAR